MTDPSYEEFVRSALPELSRLARLLAGPTDADDLVQDCLVRVGLRWSRVRQHPDPSGYARTTLFRLVVDRARWVKRTRRAVSRQAALTGPGWSEPAEPASVEIPVWVSRGWQQLSPMQRACLSLRYIYDHDAAEIAEALGCRPGTVRSHLSRGLQRLRLEAPENPMMEQSHGTN